MRTGRRATAWAGSARWAVSSERSISGVTNPLAGCSLPLDVDEVLIGALGAPRLFVAHDPGGQRWLVALSSRTGDALKWLCAPASEVAIGCALSGRAMPSDLFRHSGTGTVEVITRAPDGEFSESTRLCADLSDEEVPSAPRLLRHDRCA
jgi:hypothetical protein